MKTLGKLIKERDQRQKVLAQVCRVTEPVMSRWATRQAMIPPRALRPLARALGVSIDEIIEVAEPLPLKSPILKGTENV